MNVGYGSYYSLTLISQDRRIQKSQWHMNWSTDFWKLSEPFQLSWKMNQLILM